VAIITTVSIAAAGPWAAVSVPAPAGLVAASVALQSVSCATTGNCTAVGTYDNSAGTTQPLLLTEASGTWATGTTASLPANVDTSRPFVSLTSVSCASAGNCSAVGTYLTTSPAQAGLLLTETGGAWGAGVEASVPAGATQVSLASVSCTSAGDCSAVGTYNDSSGAATSCVGVGYASAFGATPGPSSAAEGEGVAALAVESGGSWSFVQPNLPANANALPGAALESVSCASAGNCTAVGYYTDSSNLTQGLLLTEKSGTWSTGIEAKPVQTASYVHLVSVSCASPGNCTAVGNAGFGGGPGLLFTQTSGTWGSGKAPSLPANAVTDSPVYPSSVSCTGAGDCTAVGVYYDSSNHQQGLLLTESSGTWAKGTEAIPPGGDATDPAVTIPSVSCASPGNCSAVGTYEDGSDNTQGLLLTETAGNWGAGVEASLPTGASEGFPDSVSCALAGDCSAVGYYIDGSGHQQVLLLSETSGAWAAGTEGATPAGDTTFGAQGMTVSCASVGNCAAAGSPLEDV